MVKLPRGRGGRGEGGGTQQSGYKLPGRTQVRGWSEYLGDTSNSVATVLPDVGQVGQPPIHKTANLMLDR